MVNTILLHADLACATQSFIIGKDQFSPSRAFHRRAYLSAIPATFSCAHNEATFV